jgi:copper(I)-binding protein
MLRYLLFLLAAAVAALPAAAHSHKSKGLEIVHPWTFAQAQEAGTARVFMTIKNGGGAPDRLLSASTSRAAKVELNDAGKGATAFAIEKGKDLVLSADGPSLVLTGVKKPFRAYDDFKMTLVFAKAGRVVVDVVIEEADAPHEHEHHEHMH